MTTGFIQRYKGKITVAVGGIWQGGGQSQATFINAGAPTNGTSGTLANIATKGSKLSDTTNGVTYLNTGTSASPVWTQVGPGAAVTNPITAAGSTAAGAALVSTEIGVVATIAAGTGVKLNPSAAVGTRQVIYNTTASTALKVYATDGSTIDGTAGSTGVTLSGAKAAEFRVLASGVTQSNLLGAASS